MSSVLSSGLAKEKIATSFMAFSKNLEKPILKHFKCSLCKCSYTQKFSLSQHIRRTHRKEFPFKCDLCPFGGVIKSELKLHKAKAHKIYTKVYECRFCEKIFNLASHRRLHEDEHKGIHYDCEICGKSFTQKTSLYYHIRRHQMLKCKHCVRTFKSIDDFKAHQITHSNGKNEHKLKLHYSQENNLIKACTLCNANIRSYRDLKCHVLKNHLKAFGNKIKNEEDILCWNSANQCPICGKVLRARTSHFTHILGHIGIYPYKCHLCKFRSGWIENLKTHFSTHDDKFNDMKCVHCGKVFNFKSHFSRHITSVHGDYSRHKLQLCEICGKKYLDASMLKKHIKKQHQKVDNAKCPTCDKIFSSLFELKMHRKSHIKHNKCSSSKETSCKVRVRTTLSQNGHVCKFCSIAFDTASSLEKHKKLCSVQRVCLLCENATVIQPGDYISFHLKEYHPFACLQCDICRRIFASNLSFEKHLATHSIVTSDIGCGLHLPTFDSEDEEILGIYRQKSDKKYLPRSFPIAYECGICGLFASSTKDLLEHEALHSEWTMKSPEDQYSSSFIEPNKKRETELMIVPENSRYDGVKLSKSNRKCNKFKLKIINSLSDPLSVAKETQNAIIKTNFNELQSDYPDIATSIKASGYVSFVNGLGKYFLQDKSVARSIKAKIKKLHNSYENMPIAKPISRGSNAPVDKVSPKESIFTLNIGNNSSKEFYIDVKGNERKIKEEIIYEGGRKKIVTEDFGFVLCKKRV